MNELRLQTPEGVSFSYTLASPLCRMFAVTLDAVAVLAASQALSSVAVLLSLFGPDYARAASGLGYFVVSIVYGILREYAWRGQTIGKRLFKLRVIDRQGLRLTLPQVIVRNLLRAVDLLPVGYLLGGTVALLSPRFQRLGDIAANTVVIRHPVTAQPDLAAAGTPAFNSLKRYPHLVARLRQRISPAAAGLLLDALLRRDEFEPEARVELFGELAGFCRDLVAFPDEAMDSMADEQVVRAVVDVVFEKAK